MRITVLIDRETLPDDDLTLQGKSEETCTSVEFHVTEACRHLGHEVTVLALVPNAETMITSLREAAPDLVFNLTEHWGGDRRKDSFITSLLEMLDIPFTGSGTDALKLCRDKSLSKQVLQHHGLRVPRFITLDPGKVRSRKRLHFPIVVKPSQEDGSEGIAQASLVKTQEELTARVEQLHNSLNQPVICEEYIEGRELYVGIVGNNRLKALPARELIFSQEADAGPTIATARVKQDENYRKKWGIQYIHSDLTPALQAKTANYCKKVYRLLGIQDYGRIDLRVNAKGHIYFIEANANPDLSMGDELSESWEKSGLSYEALIKTILTQAHARGQTN